MADDEQPEPPPLIRLVPPAAPARSSSQEQPGAATAPAEGGPAADLEAYRFPPLPLLSGTALLGDDGALRPIAAVTVVVTAADGSEHAVPLEPRYGGWWPPRAD